MFPSAVGRKAVSRITHWKCKTKAHWEFPEMSTRKEVVMEVLRVHVADLDLADSPDWVLDMGIISLLSMGNRVWCFRKQTWQSD